MNGHHLVKWDRGRISPTPEDNNILADQFRRIFRWAADLDRCVVLPLKNATGDYMEPQP